MAHVQWCVGNTTLREADRLKDGLRVLRDNFEGKSWSYENQQRFLELLSTTNSMDSDEPIYAMGEDKTTKQIEQHGRIWSSAFNEMGFALCYKKGNIRVGDRVIITEAGNALLSDSYLDEDVWLRQLLKLQLPNPLPQKSNSQYPDFSLLPFQATLKIMKECNGVGKDEGFLLNTLRSMEEIPEIIEKIQRFRQGKQTVSERGRSEIAKFIKEQHRDRVRELYSSEIEERIGLLGRYFEERLTGEEETGLLQEIAKLGKGSNTTKARRLIGELKRLKGCSANFDTMENIFLEYYLGVKAGAFKDYIDATGRYFRKSGLLSVRRNRIILAEERMDLIDHIIERNWSLKSNGEYLEYLHTIDKPRLPIDEIEFLQHEREDLIKNHQELSRELGVSESLEEVITKEPIHILEYRRDISQIRLSRQHLREIQYARDLENNEAINEIIEYYEAIRLRDIYGDEPTHFEWNTWRAFLAIDDLNCYPYECRNFLVDEELQPRSHAGGGVPDMVFYYRNFILVVEVTLTTGDNQWTREYRPVTSHVAEVMGDNEKPVYGLFIAPSIADNTKMHFHLRAPVILGGNRFCRPQIIPVTTEQFIQILKRYQRNSFTTTEMQNLLSDLMRLADDVEINGLEWYNRMSERIEEWCNV